MEYFRVRHTLDKKKSYGHSPQVMEVKHNCHVAYEPGFIRHHSFEKIGFQPITSTPVLHPKSKKTDLIEHLGIGFSHRLVMSGKLKDIFEAHNNDRFQCFQCPIYHRGNEDKSYWIIHPYKFNQEYIDFNKSDIQIRIRDPKGGTKLQKIEISSLVDFNSSKEFYKENGSILSVCQIVLKENIRDDFFMLRGIEGGLGYFVSERLKKEIEENQCTGIEFQPIGLSINEWLIKGGERERTYG